MGLSDRAFKRLLAEAFEGNRLLDGAAGVLGASPPGVNLGDIKAPVVQARVEYEPDRPGDPGAAALEEFELLSLATRLYAAAFPPDGAGPVDHRAIKLAQKLRLNLQAFPAVDARLLVEMIGKMAEAAIPGGAAVSPGKRNRIRRGLNLRGIRIVGDLILVNLQLPFSLRVQGCVIEGAVIADHAKLRSLDLSGSSVRGVFATFLEAGGNVRLRRTSSLSPIDFGGANVGGVLDASDAIVAPFVAPPSVSAFSGDRGVFNLSLAVIQNEFRANRLRVYGGMTMKGAIVNRSIFMERANLYAPVATLAKLAAQELRRSKQRVSDPTVLGAMDALRADAAVAELLSPSAAFRKAEIYGTPRYADDPQRQSLLFRLLAESTRTRGSALRADGLQVRGSFFGRGLIAEGRLRIKYARIGGGLHLGGCHLRTHSVAERVLKALAVVARPETRGFVDRAAASLRSATDHEKGDGDDFAMDIRETTIEGDLNLDPFAFGGAVKEDAPAFIHGAITADNVTIGGGLCLKKAWFAPSFADAPPSARSVATPSLSLAHATIGGDLRLERARGVRSLKAPHLKLGASLSMTPPDGRADPNSVAGRCEISGVIDLRNAVIGGDATVLFRPGGDVALRLRYARIVGCLNIFPALPPWRGPAAGAMSPDEDPGESMRMDREAYRRAQRRAKRRRKLSQIKSARRFKSVGSVHTGWSIDRREVVDLRSAHVGAFRHPPGAWPKQDRLLIRGFVYDSPRSLGPLGAFSGMPPARDLRAEKRWRMAAAVLFALAGLVVLAGIAMRILQGDIVSRAMPWENPAVLGWINLALLATIPLVRGGVLIRSRRVSPKRSVSRPMALEWLILQPYAPHPFRRGRHYVVSHPYLQAARILRLAGRPSLADLVEWERLKLREQAMSWRNQAPEKAFMKLVGAISGFGFNIPRTIVVGLVCWLVGAMIFEFAYHQGMMIYIDNAKDLSEDFRHRFLSFAYSADLLLPFLDGSDADRWHIAHKAVEDRPRMLLALSAAAWVLRGLGFTLTTIVAISIGTRIESYLSRQQA